MFMRGGLASRDTRFLWIFGNNVEEAMAACA